MTARALSLRALEGRSPREQMRQALLAAQLAFAYWQRAFPEREQQAPLAEAIKVVESFLAKGILPAEAKATAEAAYHTVSECDLPPGDIHRSAGFAVAHAAMTPWLYASGSLQKVAHNSKVAINYSESILLWAGNSSELEAALVSTAPGSPDA
jgi:hypothetical protein